MKTMKLWYMAGQKLPQHLHLLLVSLRDHAPGIQNNSSFAGTKLPSTGQLAGDAFW